MSDAATQRNDRGPWKWSLARFILCICVAGAVLGLIGRGYFTPQVTYDVKHFRVGDGKNGNQHELIVMYEEYGGTSRPLYLIFSPSGIFYPGAATFYQQGRTDGISDEEIGIVPEGVYYGKSPVPSKGCRTWIMRHAPSRIEPWEGLDEAQLLSLATRGDAKEIRNNDYVEASIVPVLDAESAAFFENPPDNSAAK